MGGGLGSGEEGGWGAGMGGGGGGGGGEDGGGGLNRYVILHIEKKIAGVSSPPFGRRNLSNEGSKHCSKPRKHC